MDVNQRTIDTITKDYDDYKPLVGGAGISLNLNLK